MRLHERSFGGVSGSPKCLYVSQAHTGYVGYWTLELENYKLVRSLAYENSTDKDGLDYMRGAAAFEKSAGIKALPWSSCTSYSLLKSKERLSPDKTFDAAVAVQSSATYTGKAIKPKVTVKYLGATLKAGKDYAVSYRNAKGKKVSAPKAAGFYKVTVAGKGTYKGSATKTFKIAKGTSNKQAKGAYALVVKRLSSANHRVYYKYADVVGDGTVELIALVFPTEAMPSRNVIYTMKSGKPKRIMNQATYGYWNKLTAYKGPKSLVLYGPSHNVDSYVYYKLAGGKYKQVASRSCLWPVASNQWQYSVPSGSSSKAVTKAAFDKKATPLLKGAAKHVPFKGMKLLTNDAKR